MHMPEILKGLVNLYFWNDFEDLLLRWNREWVFISVEETHTIRREFLSYIMTLSAC